MTDMLKLWFSADGVTQLALVFQAIVFVASGVSFAATVRKVQLERRSNVEQALVLASTQRDAANARLEAARLNAVLMPIELTADQQKALTVACHRFNGKAVQIRANSPDPESWLLADLIADALRSAGLRVDRTPMSGITWEGIGFGITVGGPNRELVSGLKAALETEGKFHVSLSSDKPNTVNFIALGTRPFVVK